MAIGLRIRLSVMMLLQFFVWGSWYSVLSVYLQNALSFGEVESNGIIGLIALASIFMPPIAGQITDRWVPTQVFLGVAHLAGAGAMFFAATQMKVGPMWWGIFIWSLAYAPTISLTNSLAFSHLKDPEKDFGLLRVFGTIGWILAGAALGGYRHLNPSFTGNDCLYLAGISGILMGLFCFTLPNTPPARSGVSPWAILKALQLLKDPRIAIFLLISFVVGTELPFYFALTGPFLVSIGAKEENLSMIMAIAQVAEILTMLALPWFLKHYGPRKTLFLGVLAWPVRYAIFAIGTPYDLVIASLVLHGLCFVFFFVVAFIYIDSVASKDIKASAQGLLTLVIYGFGMFVGAYFTGVVQKFFTTTVAGAAGEAASKVVNWRGVFLVPTVLTTLCALVLFKTFPRGSIQEASAAAPEPVGSQKG